MKEKEVILNGKEFKIVTRVPKEEIDDNDIKVLLDDTVELSKVIKEVKDYIEITVEDTGIGISKCDQEFIFKRFSQVEGTGAIKATSSGIGLTLVKYIVELHGGYIKLQSEVNKGSSFTIGLPNVLEKYEEECDRKFSNKGIIHSLNDKDILMD